VNKAIEFSRDKHNVFFRCVEDSNEAIMITNLDGKLVYVNPAWSKIYGYSPQEALGKSPSILHSGHQSKEFYKEMWASISDPERGYWKGELINRAKDGRLVPVLLSITPARDSEGMTAGHMGIALDYTKRKELEARVAHQDRLASIGILASGLAHEVGTPLGTIRGRAEFLMMSAKESSTRKSLETIVSQIDRISKLIRSLLRVSRSSGEIRVRDIRPLEVVQEVLALVGQNLSQDSVEVKLDLPPDHVILADFERSEQILLNLVMNSIHALRKTPVRPNAPHFLSLRTEIRKDRVALLVQDSGCGIPEENLARIFQPFFTTKEVGEGTGLGLSIVLQLAREMNAEILVESKIGVGTTFIVLFPNANTPS
jgi:PAS domain S-box-containing protein